MKYNGPLTVTYNHRQFSNRTRRAPHRAELDQLSLPRSTSRLQSSPTICSTSYENVSTEPTQGLNVTISFTMSRGTAIRIIIPRCNETRYFLKESLVSAIKGSKEGKKIDKKEKRKSVVQDARVQFVSGNNASRIDARAAWSLAAVLTAPP